MGLKHLQTLHNALVSRTEAGLGQSVRFKFNALTEIMHMNHDIGIIILLIQR